MRHYFPLRMWICFSLFTLGMIMIFHAVTGGQAHIDPAVGMLDRVMFGIVGVGSLVALWLYVKETQ